MRILEVAAALVLLSLSGCWQKTTSITVVQTPREIQARYVVVHLNPKETKSLSDATGGNASGSATHLHADVSNGALVFTGDRDQAHLPSANATVQSEFAPAPLPLAATPAAQQLMKERSGR